MQYELAKKLKDFRLGRLWTLRQMAAFLGISVQTVADLENAKRQPTELTVARIRRALPELFTEEIAIDDPAPVAEASK